MQSNHKLINITNIKFVAKCITKYTSLFSKKKKKKKGNVPKISPKKREKEYESIWYVFKQQFLIFFLNIYV